VTGPWAGLVVLVPSRCRNNEQLLQRSDCGAEQVWQAYVPSRLRAESGRSLAGPWSLQRARELEMRPGPTPVRRISARYRRSARRPPASVKRPATKSTAGRAVSQRVGPRPWLTGPVNMERCEGRQVMAELGAWSRARAGSVLNGGAAVSSSCLVRGRGRASVSLGADWVGGGAREMARGVTWTRAVTARSRDLTEAKAEAEAEADAVGGPQGR
jgi:hypothetical protein